MIWLFLAQATSKSPDEIEDIRPPILGPPAFWVVVLLAILLAFAILAYILWPNPKPRVVRPPLPKEIARSRLEKAKARISLASSYEFSVEVSDILRSFIEQQFGIKAVHQTTIEFLAEASQTSHFDLAHQEKLRHFLDSCDAIKFARVAAGQAESENLFEQASAFVEEVK
ncbi:MAG: hypothetical protein JO313_12855 [Verrucomicrobia bacterium]|nr:hypothetical protein [Verrucomicrobiota bacterium]MBV9644711.1 hypothetical protein [Verrucomicrobiota bacterium]